MVKRNFWLIPLALLGLLAVLLAAPACDDDDDDDTVANDDDTGTPGEPMILFGDLHAHSSFSIDALVQSMPLLNGNGYKPPETLCDFARYCGRLDFWSINDHPENVSPDRWRETIDAIEQCNQLEDGYGDNPSMVSFLGWEWTQNRESKEINWGHKNVILLDTDPAVVPERPIAADNLAVNMTEELIIAAVDLLQVIDSEQADYYEQMGVQVLGGMRTPLCPANVLSPDLPPDCREVAGDPATLYRKLDEWGIPAIVIPHGTAWGQHSPPGSSFRYALNREEYDPKYERLVEIHSGHGTMEEYRDWRAAEFDAAGNAICPEPSAEYTPCCWQAGEIVRAKREVCVNAPESKECEEEVATAIDEFINGDRVGKFLAIPEADPTDWSDCGQCTDCWQPPYLHRPLHTAQAALAMSDLSQPDDPWRFQWGFIGSTDSHMAGPGAGVKEVKKFSDVYGPGHAEHQGLFNMIAPLLFTEWERQMSYLTPGGLVAVHTTGRDRTSIWNALHDRQVYATSGERILLWFDLLNGPDGETAPMGAMVEQVAEPEFEVRAVGSFKQAPGCPQEILNEAGDFIDDFCYGECYNPTDERYTIDRIEIVKIEPQITPDEDLGTLIRDPFITHDCEPDSAGCTFTFSDPDYLSGERPALYYARVVQEPTAMFNAENLRCTYDEEGNCVDFDPCLDGWQGEGDECMGRDSERAWSSPIYLSP